MGAPHSSGTFSSLLPKSAGPACHYLEDAKELGVPRRGLDQMALTVSLYWWGPLTMRKYMS